MADGEHKGRGSSLAVGGETDGAGALTRLASKVSAGCVECGDCVAECAFLAARGTPKALAKRLLGADGETLKVCYECSLCGLCRAVCQYGVEPDALFLEARREAVRSGVGPLPVHKKLLSFERAGFSPLFSLFALPKGCRTVFFPGCSLPGSRPEATLWAFSRLREAEPTLGAVLSCCGKPSHDLGRAQYFTEKFGRLSRSLTQAGVLRIVVACPSCYRVFKKYAPEFETVTVYSLLAAQGVERPTAGFAALVHDSCVTRDFGEVHGAVRTLAAGAGVEVVERPERGQGTLCCGEGGGVSSAAPEFSACWTKRAAGGAKGLPILTYCSGCANYLGSLAKTLHVLDVAACGGEVELVRRPARGMGAYLNRLRVKARLKKLSLV